MRHITRWVAAVCFVAWIAPQLHAGAQPAITISDFSAAEGNAGTRDFTFQVTLSGASAEPVTVNFTTANTSAVAGSDYQETEGMLTFAPGTTAQSITVPVIGDTRFESDEQFRVILFGAVGATIADSQGTGTIENDEQEPGISIQDETEFEGQSGTTSFNFLVVLTSPSATPVSVDFTTVPGTATAPDDFVATSGTLTFEAGTTITVRSIIVPVVGDVDIEPEERFTVVLSNPNGGSISDGTAEGTILNDDFPQLFIGDASAPEGEDLVFTVTLSHARATPVTVEFETDSFSDDFEPAEGTLVFAPGETTKTITVATIEETTFEEDETMEVSLSNPVGAAIADGTGRGTIENDDVPPTISIGDASREEDDAFVTFILTLSEPSGTEMTVDFATADGTATAGDDYFATSGTLFIPAGFPFSNIPVTLREDALAEGDETFSLQLSDPAGVTIGDGQGIGTILDDEDLFQITIGNDQGLESDGTLTFTVTLSRVPDEPVTVDFTTEDVSAEAPGDYIATSGTLTFPAGAPPLQTITVTIVDDTEREFGEIFFVELSNPSVGSIIEDGHAVGTIFGNDPEADLTVTKTGPGTVEAGEPIEYLITVTNAGPDTAMNVSVLDSIPAGTTFVSATPSQGSCSGTSTVVCFLGTLALNSSATITLIVNAPMVNGQISNTATAASAESDATAAAGTANVIVVGAPAQVAGIPTVSEWGLLLMLMGLAAAAATRLRA